MILIIIIPLIILNPCFLFEQLLFSEEASLSSEGGLSKNELAELEKRVAKACCLEAHDRAKYSDDILKLAKIKKDQGKIDEAEKLYENGLETDGWNMDAKLDLANIYLEKGKKEQASNGFDFVYRRSENEDYIQRAYQGLKTLGIIPDATYGEPEKVKSRHTVVLVPMGFVGRTFFDEVAKGLRHELGANVEISDQSFSKEDLGSYDRTEYQKLVLYYFQAARDSVSPDEFNKVLERSGQMSVDLTNNTEAQLQIVLAFSDYFRELQKASSTTGDAGYTNDDFLNMLEPYQHRGQFDCDRLIELLKERFPDARGADDLSIIGLTDEDIYFNNYNFAFGGAQYNYAVVSYYRFTGQFNHSSENRKLLLERTLKQTISSSLYTFRIGRCSIPDCVHAYPSNLETLDQKDLRMCSVCRLALGK